MASYMEHPSKASRYDGGGYVVHPDAQREDTTVWFAFDTERERWEGVLAIRLANDRARLVGVPLWAYGVNLGDTVEVLESGEGAPVAVRVVEQSANRTFRVVFPDLEPGDYDERWRQLLIDLEPQQCWFDVLSPAYLAISAPAASADAVEEYLRRGTEAKEYIYERGDAE